MSDIKWIVITIAESIVRGAAQLERGSRGITIHRLPAWARAQCDDPQMAGAESKPAGVRLEFETSSTAIELDILRTTSTFAGIAPRPNGYIELAIDGQVIDRVETAGGNSSTINMSTGTVQQDQGPAFTARFTGLPDKLKNVQIWLPHNENVELLELRTDAPCIPAPDSGQPVWVHHGSSISHGSNALYPTGTWPTIAASLGGVELINLGFGGSALLDPFVARMIRDQPANLISLKLGINLTNADLLRRRALGPAIHGFLDTIRDGHPTTPLLVVSPIYCGIHEETPGPGTLDWEALSQGELRFAATGQASEVAAGKLTLQVIRQELERVVAQRQADDPNLFYLDGLELFGPSDALVRPLPDALHPDSQSHALIGERFARLAFTPGAPLSQAKLA